ncbi:hypothetical protein [Pseudoblastomonas halimionae]|uniref:Uncharacterized protein n=1 Tax=Alteriqipengyuania halimionae TaxID=1926630 RepID=A0A6I4U5B2_9SPHN|nr:hypothetical protein [Alteriqipengyuania halimionae]MXP09632.1 hypothetical protein [Alteriqipengyuania halimionae]
MSEFFSILATREWALLILFVTFLAWASWRPKTRKALGEVVLAFCNPKILGVLAIAVAYIFALLYGLHAIGLWKVGDTAATLFWMMTSALVSILNFQKAQIDQRYYRKAVVEVFSLTTLFIFLTDMVSLSLWFWLLVIPVMTLLHLLSATAKLDPAHAAVAKLLEWVKILAGLVLIYVVVREAIASKDTLLTLETLRLFALSAVLSVAFLPFIAVLTLYEPYERIFGILPLHIPDARLRRVARWRAILTFRTDTNFLERWRRSVTTEPPTNMEEVKASFAKLRTLKQRERKPPTVGEQDGWSPQSAIRFLEAEGLGTNDYHEAAYEPDEWWAASRLTQFGQGAFPNNIAYYVYGTAEIVSRLKLKMNVNSPETYEASKAHFSKHALILAGKALNETWQTKLAPILEEASPFELVEDGARVTLKRNGWQGGPGGYDLTFEILRVPAP